VLVVLAVLVLGGAVLVVPRLVRESRGPVSQRDLGTVLLVPGYGGSRDSLLALASRLEASGRHASVLTLDGDGTGDLLAQVAVLNRAAQDAVDDGAPSVDVVGYSAGGVVARLWVAGDGGALTRRVVTLGAPLHGARIAALGGVLVPDACPVACQQLTPGSALLGQVDHAPVAVPWLSVWTEDDETVQPPESAELAGAVNVALQGVCSDARVAHSQLPTDPLVTGLVLRALGTGPIAQPGVADCSTLRSQGR
jgi:triacylglycerol esterase/lipase EstA (alpha/beta hydrolase family)